MIGAEAEQFDCVINGGETSLGGDLLRPLFHYPALDLNAAAALPACQVVVVARRPALPVECLAGRVADGVDRPLLAEHLKVAVDRGEADVIAPSAQLGVDLLGAAESGKAG